MVFQAQTLVVVRYFLPVVGPLLLFITLAVSLGQAWLVGIDAQVLIYLHSLVSPASTQTAVAISLLGSGWVVTPLVVAAYLWLRRSARGESRWFFGEVAGGLLVFLVFVFAIDRPRPTLFDSPVSEPTASFPSGHAMNTTVVFLSFYLALKRLRVPWRVWVQWSGIIVVILVSVSRLYLQIHYPSDIVAGIALALGWVLLIDGWRSLITPRDSSQI